MGAAADDILDRTGRKVGNAVEDVYDHIEQKNRDRTRPPTESEKAWDETQALRRSGASDEEVDAARERFVKLRDRKKGK